MPKRYPKEFCDDVVRVARGCGPGVKLVQVAAGFGISPACLTTWMKAADVADGAKPVAGLIDGGELRELRRRNPLLEQENEVLRRAAYFAQAHLPGK